MFAYLHKKFKRGHSHWPNKVWTTFYIPVLCLYFCIQRLSYCAKSYFIIDVLCLAIALSLTYFHRKPSIQWPGKVKWCPCDQPSSCQWYKCEERSHYPTRTSTVSQPNQSKFWNDLFMAICTYFHWAVVLTYDMSPYA